MRKNESMTPVPVDCGEICWTIKLPPIFAVSPDPLEFPALMRSMIVLPAVATWAVSAKTPATIVIKPAPRANALLVPIGVILPCFDRHVSSCRHPWMILFVHTMTLIVEHRPPYNWLQPERAVNDSLFA